jgi:hypothetical protein
LRRLDWRRLLGQLHDLATLGHLEDFQRAGTIGQATDEATFLERADQAVHARLGLEIERLLHFLERGRHAGFLQAIVDEADKLVLLAR